MTAYQKYESSWRKNYNADGTQKRPDLTGNYKVKLYSTAVGEIFIEARVLGKNIFTSIMVRYTDGFAKEVASLEEALENLGL